MVARALPVQVSPGVLRFRREKRSIAMPLDVLSAGLESVYEVDISNAGEPAGFVPLVVES